MTLLIWACVPAGAQDNKRPSIKITAPTSNSSFTTNVSPLALGGTASDNVAVTQVTWSNSRGGSGIATGTTSWSVSGIVLQPGTNVLTATARDTAGNTASDTLTVTYDPTPPTVAITSPTSAATFFTKTTPLTLAGTASDNIGVTQVTWSNSAGGSGTASGTSNWSTGNITLQPGSNVLTVTARDAAGNRATATLTVTYDSTAPTVTITTPTTASTFTTTSSPLALGGTAADNVGVTQVTWSNSLGGSGAATGTTSWSVNGIVLQPGSNVLTVTARDAAGNTGTDTLTVTYTAPDTTGPAVTITSPTNNQAVNTSSITVAGTASDSGLGNNGISSVTVNGTAAAGGTATGSGTANWSQPLTLSPGSNTITVVAKDNSPAQNATTVQITVVYDPTAPTVAITSPTTATTFTATTSPITLGGTAADNIGVTQVTWSNSAGGSGTATGTTSWSASGIALVAGSNVLTVTARDGTGNTATATLTVTYTPSGGSSLVAAYTFDEGTGTTSADVSGNGYTATLVNGPAWVAGQFGSALSFDGVSSYATTSLTTDLPNWTVSGWVRSPAAPNSGTYSGPIHRESNYLFNWNHPDPTFRGAAALKIGGVWYGASFGALAANTSYYLAATYDGETLKAYRNGVLVTSNTAPSGPADSEALPLTIGRHALLTNNFFQGIVDNVRIYNRALSQAEIQSDMNTPVAPPPPDQTAPTVTIISPTSGATVSGTITVTATASDNVAVGVRFTLDGAPLGIGDTSPPYSTSWDTSTATDGSHVLSAIAQDAAGNQTASVINVNVSNGSASGPSVIGQWSAPFSLPIRVVHMMLFRTGDVLLWDAFESGQMAYLWNWSTGVLTYVPSTDNIFCAAPVLMTDGSALIVGGHSGAFVGIPNVNRFDPVTRTWGALAPMAFPRWYPTATTLPDGRVLVVSGSTTCSTCLGDIPELYNPTTNTWTQLSGARLSMPLYPHMFLLSDGRVLYAGASMGMIQTQSLDVGAQTWTMVDPVAVDGGSSTMYRPDVILKSGSAAYPTQAVITASNSAYVLDMTQPTPGWQQVGSMTFGRTYHSLTILPDGNVLATGGSATSDAASQPIYAAEIWNPQTETWSLMSSMQMARTYHETALLLPDGRVLVGGGGGCCGAPDQYNAEIFSPPYLFNGARPTIASVSTSIGYGSQFFVGTPDAASIASVALIRLGSDTHEFNRDQRYLPLSFTAVVNGLNVTMPANWNLAPPGDYMLFLVNGNGVPSVASIVTVH